MAEAPPSPRPGDPEDREDVLGKLDQLLRKHRPRVSGPGSPPLPELSDVLRADDVAGRGDIPTLVDVVSGPRREPALPSPKENPGAGTNPVVETGIILRLAGKLEAERARLLAQGGGDPARAQALDELVTELMRFLPAAVRSALRQDAAADPVSGPESDSR